MKAKHRIGMLMASLFLSRSEILFAQDFPPIYVGGEDETAELQACQISYASAIAAVESALRYSRVTVGSREDYVSVRAIEAYVNIKSISMASRGSCAADVNLSLRSAGRVVDPTGGRTHYTIIEFCNRSTLFVWPTAELQTKVNEALRDHMAECLSQYTRTIRPAA
jgi:hypothetical protein